MENIIDELVKIHNENFKNKVGDKYFSEMMLGEQYEIYCLFNFMGENIFVKKLKDESRKEDENFGKKQKEKTNFDKNEENQKNVLGYIVFYGTIESTDVFEVAIEKKYQGRGFGEILMTESMGKLSEDRKNLKGNDLWENEKTDFFENKFLLEVNEKNVKALKLYKKIGFEEISIRKNYYGKDENAVIMIKYY
ncbi:GNAT family N-acetyltransferase [Leptotrichia shahii]|uniref:GNAT family N-acetyltransferase n=1 Tax=Leptotrichia shahii TaxID=157691 RepID=UPI0028D31FA2|nr:GNAT family N-acetyltransferase [Leptotrichia shahii]